LNKLIIVLIGAVLAAGCQIKVEPGIQSGIDECENCSMIIQDVEQGAVAIDAEEELHTFCNPVCLIQEINKRKETENIPSWRIYLFNYDDKAPVPAENVYLVRGDFRTAMGYGILSFASNEKAADFAAANGGKVLDWDNLRLEYEAPDLEISLKSDNSGESGTFVVRKDGIVTVSYTNNASTDEDITLTGYDFEISVKPNSIGSELFIADKPGQGFTFHKSDGTAAGMLVVTGDHTSEEADYR